MYLLDAGELLVLVSDAGTRPRRLDLGLGDVWGFVAATERTRLDGRPGTWTSTPQTSSAAPVPARKLQLLPNDGPVAAVCGIPVTLSGRLGSST